VSFERLARLQAERDQALDRLADTSESLDAANLQIDLLHEASELSCKESLLAAALSEKVLEDLKANAALALEQHATEKESLQEVINSLRSDLLNVKATMELERANFAIERGTLDRVVEQQLARNVQLTELLNRVSPRVASKLWGRHRQKNWGSPKGAPTPGFCQVLSCPGGELMQHHLYLPLYLKCATAVCNFMMEFWWGST